MSIGLAIALVGMTSLAVALLLVPLLWRNRSAEAREAYNLAVYRDQLAELGRDVERGVLTDAQAESARAEIGRRILALAPAGAAAPGATSPMPFAVAVGAIVVLPFIAWTLYALLGSPAAPDEPFADRGKAGGPQTAEANSPHDIAQALTQLAEHLKQQPDDVNGWLLLARSDMSLGQFDKASDAYSHAAALAGDRLDILGDWGEARVLAAGGTVTPAAQEDFEKTLQDPENAPRSRYYLALAKRQQGDAKGALQAWVDLAADSPADADWLPMLRQRITETATSLGVDPNSVKASNGSSPMTKLAAAPATVSPKVPAPAAPTPAASSSVPDPAKVREAEQALASASPQDRQAMIASMVERLAARLEQQPDDLDGWARLGRSYMVLGQPAKARDAYAHAVKLAPNDPGLQEAYKTAVAAAGPAK